MFNEILYSPITAVSYSGKIDTDFFVNIIRASSSVMFPWKHLLNIGTESFGIIHFLFCDQAIYSGVNYAVQTGSK